MISRRGHDWVEIRHYKIKGTKWSVGVIGCVLHLRGKLTPQPLHSDNKDWLLWNGEAYNIVEVHTYVHIALYRIYIYVRRI